MLGLRPSLVACLASYQFSFSSPPGQLRLLVGLKELMVTGWPSGVRPGGPPHTCAPSHTPTCAMCIRGLCAHTHAPVRPPPPFPGRCHPQGARVRHPDTRLGLRCGGCRGSGKQTTCEGGGGGAGSSDLAAVGAAASTLHEGGGRSWTPPCLYPVPCTLPCVLCRWST